MNWLLTLILLSAIISWVYTHKYMEMMEDLREEFRDKEREYQKELTDLGCKYLEDVNTLQDKLNGRNQ